MGNALFDMRPVTESLPPQPGAQPPADAPASLRSVHTSNFPGLLGRLGVSLMVTTYQAGKLVVVREQAGCPEHPLPSVQISPWAWPSRPTAGGWPSARPSRSGSSATRRLFGGAIRPAAAARRLLPSAIVTRDWQHPRSRDGLGPGRGHWCVQCRRVVVHQHPFLLPRHVGPRFQLRTVRAAAVCRVRLESSDRCHLNGLAMVDLRPATSPRGVSSDEPAGPVREQGAAGGVLIDVQSNEIVARELSMPHSPRWHDGRLWLCESGAGTLGVVELQTGRYEPVVDTPGFTRGLDFAGRYAFVGLSQARTAPCSVASRSQSGWSTRRSGCAASASSISAVARWLPGSSSWTAYRRSSPCKDPPAARPDQRRRRAHAKLVCRARCRFLRNLACNARAVRQPRPGPATGRDIGSFLIDSVSGKGAP